MSAGMMPPDANGGATAPDPIAALQQALAGGGAPQDAQAPAAAPEPVVQPESLDETLNEVLGAVRGAASTSRSAQDPREVRELGQAALAFAQAWVIMHPSLVAPQGVSPDLMAAATAQQPPAPGGTTGRPPQPTARRDGQVKG